LCSVDWSDVDKASRSCTRPLISHAGRLLAAAELLLLPLDEADDRDEVGASTLARLALGAAVLDVELVPHNHVEIEIEIIRCENQKARARARSYRAAATREAVEDVAARGAAAASSSRFLLAVRVCAEAAADDAVGLVRRDMLEEVVVLTGRLDSGARCD